MSRSETSELDEDGSPSRSGPSFFKQWGPFVLVGVTALLVAGFVAFGFLTSEDEAILETASTTTSTSAAPTSDIAYPLSYSEATAQGSAESIDWGERCDTATGRLATPDFFAPECMAPFIGDNGGATSTGVGLDTIKIVQYQVADNDPIRSYIDGALRIDDTGEQQSLALTDLMSYFSDYYELYGRRVELVTYQSKGPANDEAVARADAQRIADVVRPFAVVGGPALTNAFAEELAARKVICVECGVGTSQWFKARDSFVWSADASETQKQIHLAELIQKQLVGKPAVYAGEALRETPRVFGHVYLDRGPESLAAAQQLIGRLEAIGARPAESIGYTLEPDKMAEKVKEIVTRLKAAGVTTVIMSTDPVTPRELTFEASTQEFFPEWLVPATPLVDSAMYGRLYDPRQWKQAFGISTTAPPINGATTNYRSLYEWYMGRPAYADETIERLVPPYAFLMSVIQSTGPNLTPETFVQAAQGLATRPATSQPFYRWGENTLWVDGDFSGVDDATLFWWDAAAEGVNERGRSGAGMPRFADAGKRYLPGEWPGVDRLFIPEGSVTVFDAAPPGEEPRTYPKLGTGGSDATSEDTEPPSSEPASSDPTSTAPTSSTTTTPG